jgi:hypothetical protein
MKSKTYWTISFTTLLIIATILLVISVTPLKDSLFYNEPEYAGSLSCKECHEEEFNRWLLSDHYRSSDSAGGKFFTGDFNNRIISENNFFIRFHLSENTPHISVDLPSAKSYPVVMAAGYKPFQQFIADTGSGRLQVFPYAWDNRDEAQTWYSTGNSVCFDSLQPCYWKGSANNWNSRCASCHSTGVNKNFNPANLSYNTVYSEINLGCESCHGPASNHIQWANAADREEEPPEPGDLMGLAFKMNFGYNDWKINPSTGNALINNSPFRETGINLCARCHSVRREVVSTQDYTFSYWDDFLPSFLDEKLYYPDGGIRGQAYSYGSFLQSRMYGAGVTCLDCHDAHSGELRAGGNELCSKCHSPAKYDSYEHHFHDPEEAGGSCTGCHMPSVTLFRIDERADHYIRIPRPDLTLSTGSPNACNKCHNEEDAGWSVKFMEEWYGKGFSSNKGYAHIFHSLWEKKGDALGELTNFITDTILNDFARASALAALPYHDTVVFEDLIRSGRAEKNPLMRYAAAIAAKKVVPVKSFELAFPLMDDEERAIRFAALSSASKVKMEDLPRPVKMGFSQAMTEYINILVSQGDLPENMLELADYYNFNRDYKKAAPLYRKVIRLEPYNSEAIIKLMTIYRETGNKKELEELSRSLGKLIPES